MHEGFASVEREGFEVYECGFFSQDCSLLCGVWVWVCIEAGSHLPIESRFHQWTRRISRLPRQLLRLIRICSCNKLRREQLNCTMQLSLTLATNSKQNEQVRNSHFLNDGRFRWLPRMSRARTFSGPKAGSNFKQSRARLAAFWICRQSLSAERATSPARLLQAGGLWHSCAP